MTLYEACAIAEGFSENEITIQDQLNAWSFLIKTKSVNQLQGWYGRTAAQLIDQGVFDQFGNFKGGSIYQGGGEIKLDDNVFIVKNLDDHKGYKKGQLVTVISIDEDGMLLVESKFKDKNTWYVSEDEVVKRNYAKGGSIYQGGGFFNGKKVYYDMDGKAYTLDEDNDSDFKSGDMAIFGDALDSVIEVYFNEDDEDADDEYFINNTYLHVKLIPNNV